MRSSLVFRTSLIVAGLAISACDDGSLNQNATTLIKDHQTRQANATDAEKNSYYYLLSIGSKDEPLEAGKAYHEALQQALAQQGDLEKNISQLNARHHLNDLSTTLQLNHSNAKANHDIFCTLTSDSHQAHDCFAMLSDHDADLTPYHVLQERYWVFLNNPPAIMQGKMRVENLLPDYKVIIHGQRVHLIHTLKRSPDKVMPALSHELSLLRNHLANANTLIEKMILANMVIHQLQAMVFVKNQHPTIATDIVPPMTSDELSLKNPIISEFMLNYELYNNLDNALDGNMDMPTQLFYKKYRTINQAANFYQEGIISSQLPAPDFAAAFDDEVVTPKKDYINYVGGTLLNIALPDYKHYAARVKSLDNIINIANHIMNDTPLKNIFAPTLTGNQTQTTHICLQNPLGQDTNDHTNNPNKKYECLNVNP